MSETKQAPNKKKHRKQPNVVAAQDTHLQKVIEKKQAVSDQLERIIQEEQDIRLSALLADNHEYQKLMEQARGMVKEVQFKKLLIKRKNFAIRVREGRLRSIPQEIKSIQDERQTAEEQLTQLEVKKTNIHQAIERIRSAARQQITQNNA